MKVKTERLSDVYLPSLIDRLEGIMELHIKQGATIISTQVMETGLVFFGVIFYKES